MGSIDDLPPQNPAQWIQDKAEAAFEAALRSNGQIFDHQQRDRRDYGTDYQLELIDRGQRTNLRVHVQLKGTDCEPNADGSISISVPRTNLNYLINQPASVYVCYSIRGKRLLVRDAIDVFRIYEDERSNGYDWKSQDWITVRFSEPFDKKFQNRLHRLAVASGRAGRSTRIAWSVTPHEQIKSLAIHPAQSVHVPMDKARALALLEQLYKVGNDEAISSSFEQFHAVTDEARALDLLYMAEINLGLNEKPFDPARVRAAIKISKRESLSGRVLLLVRYSTAWEMLGWHSAITRGQPYSTRRL